MPMPVMVAATHRRKRTTPVVSVDAAGAALGTFARTGDARFFDANGVVQVAGTNVIRNAHYVTARRGVLLEPARTNLAIRSEEFNSGSWTKVNASVLSNQIAAPDGATTADLLTASTTGGYAEMVCTFTGNGEKSCSVFLKAGTSARSQLAIVDATAANVRHRVNINWSGGVPSVATQTGSGTIYGPIALGDGWYYLGISAVGIVATNTNGVRCYPDAVAGTGTTYFWGAGAENAPIPTSYIPTVAATADRNAETLTQTVAQAWQPMTFYARIPYESGTGFSEGTYFALKPSAASPVVSINRDTTGNYRISHNNGSTTVHGAVGSASTLGAIVEIRGIVNFDGSVQAGISVNGAAESLGSVSAANAFSATQPDRVEFGTVLNAPLLFSHFLIANGVRSLAQMRSAAGVQT